MHAAQLLTLHGAERLPELRRSSGRRGRVRPPRVAPAERADVVWVTSSPWTVHYVPLPPR
jgi:hypothetical protein